MRQFLLLVSVFVLGGVVALQFHSHSETSNLIIQPLEQRNNISSQAPILPITTNNRLRTEIVNSKESLLTGIQKLMLQGDYETVMQRYQLSQNQLVENELVKIQNLILNHIQDLDQAGQTFLARTFLTRFLDIEYNNVNGLELLARLNHNENRHFAELEAWYRAKSYAHTDEKLATISESIRLTVSRLSQSLESQDDHISLLNLYKRLTELEPEYAPHYIGLAETYVALGNKVDARKALDLAMHDPNVANHVSNILLALEQTSLLDFSKSSDISLVAEGNQFLVDATLNNHQPARLLLDTGASLSIISLQLVNKLGLEHQNTFRTAWFNTANGRVEAPIVVIDSISLQDQEITSIEVGILNISSNKFDGLLGMNFLRHFEFFIDQRNSVLRLTAHR